jgi:hypothetical protein
MIDQLQTTINPCHPDEIILSVEEGLRLIPELPAYLEKAKALEIKFAFLKISQKLYRELIRRALIDALETPKPTKQDPGGYGSGLPSPVPDPSPIDKNSGKGKQV